MADFVVAHVCERAVDLIVIPRDRSLGHRSQTEQNAISADLKA